MKRLIIVTAVIVGIPFFVVHFLNVPEKNYKEIELKYLSNIFVRVKRSSGNIERVPLEEYVVGVVAGEMPVSFELEALKAQSVASRSYVMRRLGGNGNYDVTDTVSNQVYLDDNELKEKWKDKYSQYISKVRQAVNETSMECLEYNGEIIDAMFFSTSNGYTEKASLVFNIDLPYLQSVTSMWDSSTSSAFRSTKKISIDEFYSSLNLEYSNTLDFKVLRRSSTNRILNLSINGKEFTGKEVYDKLGLKSMDFSLKQDGNNIIIDTVGYGHGVGMSQYGAEGMALEGYSYKDILSHYYVGTSIKKIKN